MLSPSRRPFLEAIIAKEKPDAILPTLGGQTALNAAMALHTEGILQKYGVELIGASFEAIQRGEDRQIFKDLVLEAGADVARSHIATTVQDAITFAEDLGYPLVIRPSYTMGGLGSGFAHDQEELVRMVTDGLHQSPTTEVLLEESILGWKEYELELMRDSADNTVVVCSIENVDPVGVHTGDSITVAPALTLTDREYQRLRDIGIQIIRLVGVDTGGCNIQFAIEPSTGRVIVIEMNPRVSRSSALASKATGFPIAKIAAKLALGYRLDEIPNDITQVTPASFEPTLDYVVVKVPRFAFEKFPLADPTLTTTMKSVGEAMALGRNFSQALNKALRSLEQRGSSFHWGEQSRSAKELVEISRVPTDGRIVTVQQALRQGASVEDLYAATGIDPWFLDQIALINEVAEEVRRGENLSSDLLRYGKDHGLSDVQIAQLRGTTEAEVRSLRHELGMRPVFKTVDTCAGEFPAYTPYHYSSYDLSSEVTMSEKTKVVILGSGPNRIGQGIEFDYSCVHAAFALHDAGFETIMINCNPETVSTDYDTSDRLYFEPLTLEDVLEVIHQESQSGVLLGVLVQLGGQTALGLAKGLEEAGVPILGTSPSAIDLAEERGSFARILDEAGLVAPKNGTATNVEDALAIAQDIGYPVLVRPSYVLGGRGMEIVYDHASLVDYFDRIAEFAIVGPEAPLLVDRFLDDAVEIDVDALYDGRPALHRRRHGTHRGSGNPLGRFRLHPAAGNPGTRCCRDSMRGGRETCPGDWRARSHQRSVRRSSWCSLRLGGESQSEPDSSLRLEGPRNSAWPVPRPLVMAGSSIASLIDSQASCPLTDGRRPPLDSPVAVKEAVLPFKRFRTPSGDIVDSILGPEMRSTGEVMGIDSTFPKAFAKSQDAAYGGLPQSGTVFVSVADRDKRSVILPILRLSQLGFHLIATEGTAETLGRYGISAEVVRKHTEVSGSGEGPSVVDLIQDNKIDIVINTPRGRSARADGYEIRTATVAADKALFTTIAQVGAAVASLEQRPDTPEVTSLQDYQRRRDLASS
jgi:carbamoyl-phosphate synthase large subunit